VRLIPLEAWLARHFGEPRPAMVTARRWARIGKIPARKVGGDWFVDEVKWLADGNRLVERVLAG
jgi:hypothetical protein